MSEYFEDNPSDHSGFATRPPEAMGQKPNLSFSHLLGRAWPVFKAHLGTCVGMTALIGVLFLAVGMIPFIGLLGFLFLPALLVGAKYICLKMLRGEQTNAGMIFHGMSHFGKALAVFVFSSLIIVFLYMMPLLALVANSNMGDLGLPPSMESFLPIIFFVAPGIALAACFAIYAREIPAMHLVMDENLGVFATVRRSKELSRGHVLRLLWLVVITSVLNLIGMLFCFVGLLFTIPLGWLVLSAAYEELRGNQVQQAIPLAPSIATSPPVKPIG